MYAYIMVLKSVPFFSLVFSVDEAFFQEFSLGGQTPWWGRLPSLDSGISFLFGSWRLQFPFWLCLFIQKWGIPSSQPSTIPTLLHAFLSPTVIPQSRNCRGLHWGRGFAKSVSISAVEGIIFLLQNQLCKYLISKVTFGKLKWLAKISGSLLEILKKKKKRQIPKLYLNFCPCCHNFKLASEDLSEKWCFLIWFYWSNFTSYFWDWVGFSRTPESIEYVTGVQLPGGVQYQCSDLVVTALGACRQIVHITAGFLQP